jgi:2-dehydropantoate 2-reductase
MQKQNFTSYALLGSGRVARHFRFYLDNLDLPCRFWSRRENEIADLKTVVAESSHILFAVSDSALEQMIAPWRGSDKVLVHFSGALEIAGSYSAHPLMTFGPDLETSEWYWRIPFVLDEGVTLHQVLPGLSNPSLSLSPAQRPLYHALVSLAGNSTFLLWQNIGHEMSRLGLPPSVLAPFLHQVVRNATEQGEDGFTGPVARGDWPTVARHAQALKDSGLEASYKAYLRMARSKGYEIPEDML